MNKSFLFSSLLLAIVVFASLLLSSSSSSLVSAKLCKESRSSSIWKHEKGSFKKVGPKTWKEFNDKNIPSPDEFEQVLTEGTAVVIHDKKRNVQILLKDDVAGIKNAEAIRRNDPNFNQLYSGHFIKVMDCT